MRGRRLGAIMFTDIVGYTSMSSRDEAKALKLLRRCRNSLQSVFPKFGGRVIKTIGDRFLVEFASAVDAVDCAVESQRQMRKLNASLGEDRVLIRIGVHVGDVVHAEDDVLGDAVNVASRVEPLAEPGGICVTRQVVDQVEGKVDWRITSMGMQALKNVPNLMEVFSVKDARLRRPREEHRPGHHRVAILPFANLSQNANDKYFADGMTEEMISTVSKIGGLSVISRASAMRYKDTSLPIAQIGRELNVVAILEGSVRKAGNRVRIAAHLIEVDKDRYVWSQSYDRNLVDIFAVQGEIAQQMAEGLKIQLLSREMKVLERKPTLDTRAYTLYLKGRFHWNERTEDGVGRAARYFQEALKVDPKFAMAYAGLADCYLILANYEWMVPATAGELAKQNAMRALAIDDSLAEAHASLGLVYINHAWDFAAGQREIKRAIELDSNYVSAYHWYSVLLCFMRRYQDSLRMIRRAAELDPYSHVVRQSMGVSLMGLRRYDEAMDQFNAVEQEKPRLASVHFWKSLVYLDQSNHAKAIEEAKKEVEFDDHSDGAKLDMAFVQSEAGDRKEAERILDEVLAKKGGYHSPCSLGIVMLSLGRVEDALGWMEKALLEHDSSLLYFTSIPAYRKYASQPGWAKIERKVELFGRHLASPS